MKTNTDHVGPGKYIRTPETLAKLSASQKIGYQEHPERKEKMSELKKNYWKENPQARILIGVLHKDKPLSAEQRAKMCVSQRKRYEDPVEREKTSAASKRNWENPDYRARLSLAFSGENNPQWRGGLKNQPYCPKWNEDLRRRIRAFFDYRCIACGKTMKENRRALHCHHVSYDKMVCCNDRPVRFAALCNRHHSLTNNDRDRWELIFHRIIDEIYDGRSYFTKEEWREICNSE